MTGLDGQTLAALICVLLALAALGRWSVRWWRGQSGGGCGACANHCGQVTESEPTRLKVILPIVDVSKLEPAKESKRRK